MIHVKHVRNIDQKDYLIIIKLNNMNKSTYVGIVILFFIGCTDKKVPKEDELKQYPWIELFAPNMIDFKGIEHNLDLGIYSFSFETRLPNIDAYFDLTDSVALTNNWEIIKASTMERKYRKPSAIYKASYGFDYISLEYNFKKQRVTLTSEVNKSGNLN